MTWVASGVGSGTAPSIWAAAAAAAAGEVRRGRGGRCSGARVRQASLGVRSWQAQGCRCRAPPRCWWPGPAPVHAPGRLQLRQGAARRCSRRARAARGPLPGRPSGGGGRRKGRPPGGAARLPLTQNRIETSTAQVPGAIVRRQRQRQGAVADTGDGLRVTPGPGAVECAGDGLGRVQTAFKAVKLLCVITDGVQGRVERRTNRDTTLRTVNVPRSSAHRAERLTYYA